MNIVMTEIEALHSRQINGPFRDDVGCFWPALLHPRSPGALRKKCHDGAPFCRN